MFNSDCGDILRLHRIAIIGLLIGAVFEPPIAQACTTAAGVDYRFIDDRQVIVKANVTSFRLDWSTKRYAFNISVSKTLKGATRSDWIVTTPFGPTMWHEWPEQGPVYLGFDIEDAKSGYGHFEHPLCRSLPIVSATDENLMKLQARVEEKSPF